MKTIIHVNQHVIKANAKAKSGPRRHPLTVKTYKDNRRASRVVGYNDDGSVAFEVVYRPDRPLDCGAKCWVEMSLRVETE